MPRDVQLWPARWASELYVHLTTVGRRTGRPHRIELWFAEHDERLYMLSGGRELIWQLTMDSRNAFHRRTDPRRGRRLFLAPGHSSEGLHHVPAKDRRPDDDRHRDERPPMAPPTSPLVKDIPMNPRYDFTGQVALVTGASSGMGLATAQAFAEAGAAVVLVDINAGALRAVTD